MENRIFYLSDSIFPIPYDKKETMPYIIRQLESGVFSPLIDREYPLNDISKAYDYVMRGEKTGNVIINWKKTNA